MRIVAKRSGPNLVTFRKIQNLVAYREDYIKEKGVAPGWIQACQRIGIGHRTVKKYARALTENWKDITFRW